MKLIFSFILSFLFTLYVIPILKVLAFKFNILDVPNGSIKVHKTPIPYLGGVGVYFGFITALGMTLPFENKIFLFLIGSTMLLFIGLVDDLINMSPGQKFFGQMIAAFCFLKAGFYLKYGFFCNNFLSFPISFLWILVVINAFNLVDIMDGLATTIACSVTISFIFIAAYLGNTSILILLLSFLGALFGFLVYNKPDAKIYLGDAGALFIGGFLAVVPFLFNWSAYNPYGFITPVILLAIPLIEVATLIVIRTYKKIPFYRGSPDHFAIYLQNKGWSKNKVLIYTIFVSIILFITTFLFFINKISIIAIFLLSIIFIIFWYLVLFLKKPIL